MANNILQRATFVLLAIISTLYLRSLAIDYRKDRENEAEVERTIEKINKISNKYKKLKVYKTKSIKRSLIGDSSQPDLTVFYDYNEAEMAEVLMMVYGEYQSIPIRWIRITSEFDGRTNSISNGNLLRNE